MLCANLREKFTEKLISTYFIKQIPRTRNQSPIIVDMEQLPTGATELAKSGTAELEIFLEHYGEGKNGCVPHVDCNASKDEWMLMRQLVSKHYPAMQMHPLWELLYTVNIEKHFQISYSWFQQPSQFQYITSAGYERGFSTQNRIKCAHRMSLRRITL